MAGREGEMIPGIKAVAFDVDGTLYPERSYVLRMILAGWRHPLLSFAYNRARVRYRVEQGREATVPANRAGYLRRLSVLMLGILRRRPSERNIKAMTAKVERVFARSWERLYRRVPGRKGMRDTLHALHAAGYRIAVLSDFPLAGKLAALGVEDVVDVAFCSEETGYLKPDGRVFSRLLACIDCSADAVLYVGDSYAKDACGSKRSGMRSCLLASGTNKSYPQADFVVRSYRDLSRLLLK